MGWHEILYLWELSHWALYLLKPWLLYLTTYCQKCYTRLNNGTDCQNWASFIVRDHLDVKHIFLCPHVFVSSWWSGTIIPPQMVTPFLVWWSCGKRIMRKRVSAIAWNIMRSSECPLVEVFTLWQPGLLSNPEKSVSGMIRKNSSSGFLKVSINGIVCIFMFFCFCIHVFYLKRTYCRVIGGWFCVFTTFLSDGFFFLHHIFSILHMVVVMNWRKVNGLKSGGYGPLNHPTYLYLPVLVTLFMPDPLFPLNL